jgi:hypothetical protein
LARKIRELANFLFYTEGNWCKQLAPPCYQPVANLIPVGYRESAQLLVPASTAVKTHMRQQAHMILEADVNFHIGSAIFIHATTIIHDLANVSSWQIRTVVKKSASSTSFTRSRNDMIAASSRC